MRSTLKADTNHVGCLVAFDPGQVRRHYYHEYPIGPFRSGLRLDAEQSVARIQAHHYGGDVAKVAVFCDVYLPGFKAGGPVPSISRIIENDGTHEFRVITSDRDIGEAKPYSAAVPRCWNSVGSASVAYLRPGLRDRAWLLDELRAWAPDFYYLNSLHSPRSTILPLLEMRLRRTPSAYLVLAPRGEASLGALGLKRWKKLIAKPALKLLIGNSLTWHVSSTYEKEDVRQWWGRRLPKRHRFRVQADLSVAPASSASLGDPLPADDPIVTFASRIDRMKGLDAAIRLMAEVDAPFSFRVTGTIADPEYWQECCRLAEVELTRRGMRFTYAGAFRPQDVRGIFSESTLMLLPTRGENFGHVIAEAMSVGCPVLISDTTPWTQVVQYGGGSILTGTPADASFVERVLTEGIVERSIRRREVLEGYCRWFEANQESRTLFEFKD